MGRNQRDERLVIQRSPVFTTGAIGDEIVVSNATNTVTISNVAPAAVGTATIGKWLQVNLDGTYYYIPMWT